MWRRPRLCLSGTLTALAMLVPATALAQSGSSVEPKIVGGNAASVATYPWQAAVVFSPAKRSGNAHNRQFCGGSLLTSRIVITAGHCVADSDPDCTVCSAPICLNPPSSTEDGTCKLDPDDVDVVLGRSTLSNTGQGAEMSVQAVKLRDNFDGNYQGDGVPRFDVAYLVLSSASGQTPIKIADAGAGALWDAGSPEDISGWGSTFDGGSTVDALRAATVPVIADSTCSADYANDFDPSTMVCAGNGAADTCAGDSGGPLEAVLPGGGYRLVGLTGWGEGCGEASFPGVYTRVAGPTMSSLIASDVSTLEAAQGLAPEDIFGDGGGQARTSIPVPAGTTKSANRFKKCKRIHNRKKRKRCVKRVKARNRAQSLS